jgi:hypothetical protein
MVSKPSTDSVLFIFFLLRFADCLLFILMFAHCLFFILMWLLFFILKFSETIEASVFL